MSREPFADPTPVEVFLDRDTGRPVSYVGEMGGAPWFRYLDGDGDSFHCDWLDVYLWGRFERTRED